MATEKQYLTEDFSGSISTGVLLDKLKSSSVPANQVIPNATGAIVYYSEDVTDFTTSDACITAHTGYAVETLEDLKERKRKKIRANTARIEADLTFSYAGSTYNLSPSYQDKWMNLFTLSSAGLIAYPKNVYDTNGIAHGLADHAEVTAFIGTGLGAAEAFFSTDDQYFIDIEAAADVAALDAVIDNR